MKNLRKVFACFFAIICLAGLSLVGCSSTKSKTITVIAYVDGVETERKEIDIFNNAILTEPSEDKTPTGKVFYGWSTSENWTEDSNEFVVEGNFISYNKVKDVAKKGEVKLYPAYKVKIEKYFVFGVWTGLKADKNLNNEKKIDSNLDASKLSTLETSLKSFLKTNGVTDEQLTKVEIREYSDTAVGNYGAKVTKDGDVNIFFGSGSNFNTDGGVTIVTMSDGITVLPYIDGASTSTNRRLSLLKDDELSVKVYNWFLSEFIPSQTNSYTHTTSPLQITFSLGDHAIETAVCPELSYLVYAKGKMTLPEAPEVVEGYVFEGWKIGDSTILVNAGEMIDLTASVHIVAQYKSTAAITVTYSNGLTTRTSSETAPASQNIAPGTSVTLPDAPTAKAGFVFAGWRVGAELKNAGDKIVVNEALQITAEYTVDTTIDTTIIVGYYAKSDTSGVTDAIASNVETALKAYLEGVGITDFTNLVMKGYGAPKKNVADTVTEINNDIDAGENVGIFFGFKAYGKLNVDSDNIREGFVINGVEERRVFKLADNAISNIIFDWMVAENSTFLDAIKTPTL